MYPTNYMNPMNNQPMSPDYGYNRMQQVQQMQQAINPTVPNMFGQMNQMNNMNQQQQTPYISAIPVTCLDEAKAARISLDGTLSVFINIQDGEIYTKQLNMNGLAELKTYKLVNPQENKVEYITSDIFNGLDQRVQNIEQLLASIGGNNHESNANVTSTNLKRFCLVLAQNLPEGANTLPVQISIGGTTYPVYTRTGNLLRADQIRCRRVYPIIFGNDPNHFSLLCCVPNTVYTPPVVVPTEG